MRRIGTRSALLAIGTTAVLATLLSACDSSAHSGPPTAPSSSIVAEPAADPDTLLTRLRDAGIACTPLALDAFQYPPGGTQIHCVRGTTTPPISSSSSAGSGAAVTLRVYDSAAAMRVDRSALAREGIAVLAGPNWTVLADPYALETLRRALGGTIIAAGAG